LENRDSPREYETKADGVHAMAKRKSVSETTEQIAARLKLADAERNEARGAGVIHAEQQAEKARWKTVMDAIQPDRRAMAGKILAGSDMTPDEVIAACRVGTSGNASSDQPSNNQSLFLTGAQSAARLLGLPPEAANALAPFVDATEIKPFDMDAYEAGAESAKAILAMTGASK
jgi:hypothetical protein